MIGRHPAFFTILFFLLFMICIPVGILYFVICSPAFSHLLDFITNILFPTAKVQYYQPFYRYVVELIFYPLTMWFAFGSFLVYPLAAPNSMIQDFPKKRKVKVISILAALFLIMLYSIAFIHLPDVVKDLNCVERGITRQITSDNYNVYTKKDIKGRYNQSVTSYYVNFYETEGSKLLRTFPIGRDFYEYLQIHKNQRITVNYMPNTGVFLNVVVGDEKFGTFPKRESN